MLYYCMDKEFQEQLNRHQEKYEKVLDEKDKFRSSQYELKLSLDHAKSEIEQKDFLIAELKKKLDKLENK